jgi:hypothetical protein
MHWRRWLALFGVLALGFGLYVFFSGASVFFGGEALDWQTGFQGLDRCTRAAPATLWVPPIRTPKPARGQLAGRSREAVSVGYSLDSTPPGAHCSVRRCRLKRPGYYGEFLVDAANPPCRPIFRSARFFIPAHAKDYLWVLAYGGGFALFFTVLLFGWFAAFRAGRWAYRRAVRRRLRPGT